MEPGELVWPKILTRCLGYRNFACHNPTETEIEQVRESKQKSVLELTYRKPKLKTHRIY